MDNNSERKPTVPTRLPPAPSQRPQQPPNDAVAKQGSPLSLRPVWQAIPRLASYGMVGFIIWIIGFGNVPLSQTLKDCATDDAHWSEATDTAQLRQRFSQIAQTIGGLRLSS